MKWQEPLPNIEKLSRPAPGRCTSVQSPWGRCQALARGLEVVSDRGWGGEPLPWGTSQPRGIECVELVAEAAADDIRPDTQTWFLMKALLHRTKKEDFLSFHPSYLLLSRSLERRVVGPVETVIRSTSFDDECESNFVIVYRGSEAVLATVASSWWLSVHNYWPKFIGTTGKRWFWWRHKGKKCEVVCGKPPFHLLTLPALLSTWV